MNTYKAQEEMLLAGRTLELSDEALAGVHGGDWGNGSSWGNNDDWGYRRHRHHRHHHHHHHNPWGWDNGYDDGGGWDNGYDDGGDWDNGY